MRRNAGVNQIAHYSPENNRDEHHQNYKKKMFHYAVLHVAN